MRPSCRHTIVSIVGMKAGIGAGLQNAAVMGEMPLGMIAAAIA
jgi:hypothetical protein